MGTREFAVKVGLLDFEKKLDAVRRPVEGHKSPYLISWWHAGATDSTSCGRFWLRQKDKKN
jgi:hypothetical protein